MLLTVQFECEATRVADALDALRKFNARNPRVFESKPLPKSPLLAREFEEQAQKVAKLVRPREGQEIRREALKFMLEGNDTFLGLQGERDTALRNATGAISRSLRRIDRFAESPLDLIVTRKREVFSSGPAKGIYRGTRYIPTKLGERVRQILKDWGEI